MSYTNEPAIQARPIQGPHKNIWSKKSIAEKLGKQAKVILVFKAGKINIIA